MESVARQFTEATILGARGIPVVCHAVKGSVSDIALAPTLLLNMVETTALHWDRVLSPRAVTATHVQFMEDTVLGHSGVRAVPHVAAACVPGYAPAPIHHPSMEAMTVMGLDRARSRSYATVRTAVQTPAVLPRRPGLIVVFIIYHHSNAVIKAVVSTARSLTVFHTVTILSVFSKSKFSTP